MRLYLLRKIEWSTLVLPKVVSILVPMLRIDKFLARHVPTGMLAYFTFLI